MKVRIYEDYRDSLISKLKKRIWVLISLVTFFVTIAIGGILYISINNVPELGNKIKNQKETIENLEELVSKKDFAWTAADMEIDNLEQIIASKDELILELRVQEEVLGHTKEMLEYSLTYIHFVQVVMEKNGIVYPEFVIENILTDDFLENGIEIDN